MPLVSGDIEDPVSRRRGAERVSAASIMRHVGDPANAVARRRGADVETMQAAITVEDAARRHERLAASHDRQRVPPNGGWTLIVRIPVDVRAARREQAMIGGRHGRGKLPAAYSIVCVERIRPAIFHHRRGDASTACPRGAQNAPPQSRLGQSRGIPGNSLWFDRLETSCRDHSVLWMEKVSQ